MSGSTASQSDWGSKIWLDNKLVNFHEATIHVMTYSLHYGVGVFEGIRAYPQPDGRAGIFRLREHLERFLFSLKALMLESPYSLEELEKAVIETVRASGFNDCYIRPIAFLNIAKLGIKPPTRKVSVAIGVLRWGKYLGKAYEEGARVKTSQWRRPSPQTLPVNAKATGNYLNSYITTTEAKEKGYDEALLLNTEGYVSEGPGQNIFIVKKGRVLTPPVSASILEGITRDTIITLLHDRFDIEVEEQDLTLGIVYSADEAFFVGTATEVTPIVEVDGRPIGAGKPGPLTRKLQKLYEDVVRGRVEEYRHWITPV